MSSEHDPNAYYQWGGVIGTFIVGLWAAVVGTRRSMRRKYEPEDAEELRKLQEKLDMVEMRKDFEIVVEALKTSINNRLDRFTEDIHGEMASLRDRVHEAELTIARFTSQRGP